MNTHPSEPTDGQPAHADSTRPIPEHPAGGQQPSGGPHENSFFAWLRQLGVRRSPDRWIGGVAGGIANRTGLDPILVRGIVIVLSLFGIGVVLYGVAWALLPEPDGRIHLEEATRGNWSSGMTGALAFTILGFGGPGFSSWATDGWLGTIFWGLFWIAAVILTIYWLTTRGNSPAGGTPNGTPRPPAGGQQWPAAGSTAPGSQPATSHPAAGTRPSSGSYPLAGYPGPDAPTMPLPSPSGAYERRPGQSAGGTGSRAEGQFSGAYLQYPPPSSAAETRRTTPPASWTALISGVALLAAGTLLAVNYAGIYEFGAPAAVALAAAGVVLGLGVVGLGTAGRSSGLVGGLGVLALIAALLFSSNVAYRNLVVANQVNWSASQSDSAREGYSMAAAGGSLDLRSLADEVKNSGDVYVPVSIAAGDLVIVVPDDVRVSIEADIAMGNIDLDRDGTVTSSGGVWAGRQLPDLNPDASGHRMILQLKGVASNILVTTDESSLN